MNSKQGMKTNPPQVHRVERVDDIPVLLATLQRLKVAEIGMVQKRAF
jgi:hypothetical protein